MAGGNNDSPAEVSTSAPRRRSNGATPTTATGSLLFNRKINEQTYSFNGWKITVLKSPILPSVCYCNVLDESNSKGILLELGRNAEDIKFPVDDSTLKCQVCRYSEQLSLKHLPDMVFPDNYVHVLHEATGVALEFNTLEALKTISVQDTESFQVAFSEEWQASKDEAGLPSKEVLHDYNWTFATDYKGSVKRLNNGSEVNIVETPEDINIEKLKQKEPILFYDELTLFEDELHDSGTSNLSLKLRVMPSGFFILLRHLLRVDHVMIRICDTRIHYEVENNFFLRQFQMKQQSFRNLVNVDPHQFADINVIAQHLPVVKQVTEKILIQ